MKLNYDSPFVDLVNAYIDTVEDDSLTSNQQDQILDDVETWIRQKVEPIPALLDAAPELLEALEALMEFWDNDSPVYPGSLAVHEAREALAKAKGENR